MDIKIFNNLHFVAGWTWYSFGIGIGFTRYAISIDLGFFYMGFEW